MTPRVIAAMLGDEAYRALLDAAHRRGLTPDGLVVQIVREWLASRKEE